MKKGLIGEDSVDVKLRESEVFYRHLVELTPDAVVVHSKGKVVFVNPAAVRLIGAESAEQLIGRGVLEFIHPDSKKIVIARMVRMMIDKKPTPMIEEKFIDLKGRVLIAEVRTMPFLFEGKQAALTILHDITMQKQAQEEMKKSRDQLEAILTNVADGITAQDTSGRVIYANAAAARLVGFESAEQMLTATPADYLERFEMFDEKGKPFPFADLPGRRALAGEKNPSAIIKYLNKKTEEVRWSLVKSTAIYNSEGEPELAVNVIIDLTERKELENRKDDFISMASHELKTPLTSIGIYSQVLQKQLKKLNDKKALELQEKINKQLANLTELVKELLDVSAIERKKMKLNKEEFLVKELAEEIVESLRFVSDHELELDWHTKSPVVADRERIRQVLINLVSNAIKYSPQNTKIRIRSKKKDNMIVVSVHDAGIGIPEQEISKLFGRFYQAGNGEKTYPGLGLGLYISNQIIAIHGGQMWAESKVGKGSTFYFSLPIAE